jgi:predicted DNA-binding transcriptional regulator YafY
MYSPTTRLLTVLELLQSYRGMSGSELARRLEVDIRTVRRYIVMLQDMGIPIEAERGPHGSYQLRRGFKLPPLMFTDDEAVSLTLGLLAIREFRFPVNVEAIEGALAKTERVMPEKLLTQARALQEAITFNVVPPTRIHNNYVTQLSLAVKNRQQVQMSYLSFRGDATARAVDPYGIVFHEGYWYTAGYCHLRAGLRTFRIDRIATLELLEAAFERPADFDPLRHVLASLDSIPGPYAAEILLQTTLAEAQAALPSMSSGLEETAEGVIWRRAVRHLEWMAYVLIGLDFPVVIRQPEELREAVRGIITRLQRMTGDAPPQAEAEPAQPQFAMS